MKAVIVTGGYVNDAFALPYIKDVEADVLIAVDKGMQFFCRNGLKPDYVVGDFDSAKPDIVDLYRHMSGVNFQEYPSEKNETDTEIAIGIAKELKCDAVELIGATGERLDHVLGNIQMLGQLMEAGIAGYIVDENNRIQMVNHAVSIRKDRQHGKYVSLIPFTPVVEGIVLTGFKYPLDGYDLKSYIARCVSNEIVEEEARISFDRGILLVIESKDGQEVK